MANRVTIQDIADALGVSRNTVSKAINDTGILADATREKILKKRRRWAISNLLTSSPPTLAEWPSCRRHWIKKERSSSLPLCSGQDHLMYLL